ncbi:MAG: DUF3789 domain-containing protein [Eubacteriales bacterium]|nr:DUF3789 domain-containing protein [Eubacteriales bacterium]
MKMMTVITHFIAMSVGSAIGVIAMCLVQAGKNN